MVFGLTAITGAAGTHWIYVAADFPVFGRTRACTFLQVYVCVCVYTLSVLAFPSIGNAGMTSLDTVAVSWLFTSSRWTGKYMLFSVYMYCESQNSACLSLSNLRLSQI